MGLPTSRRSDPNLWGHLQQRLAAAAQATQESSRTSPERARAILEERARRLAQSAPQAARDGDRVLAVTFTLGGQRYALDGAFVREVRQPVSLTPLPGAPDYCAGIVNLRGNVLPAFYLHRLLGLSLVETPAERILFVGADRAELGFLAETVFEVATLDATELLAPAGTVPAAAQPYVRGIMPDGLVLLGAEALLQDPRLVIDQKEESL